MTPEKESIEIESITCSDDSCEQPARDAQRFSVDTEALPCPEGINARSLLLETSISGAGDFTILKIGEAETVDQCQSVNVLQHSQETCLRRYMSSV